MSVQAVRRYRKVSLSKRSLTIRRSGDYRKQMRGMALSDLAEAYVALAGRVLVEDGEPELVCVSLEGWQGTPQ